MDHADDPGGRPDPKTALSRWVAEMQGVMTTITGLIEDSDRHRAVAESAQRGQAELREELGRLRGEVDRQRAEAERLRGESERNRGEADRHHEEAERLRAVVETTQRERDDLRAEITALHAETERLRSEQVEAGETAAKLLGEMKDLVNQVAHKFQGPSKSSPFAREPRSPQP
jgi:chromosome segregation ATPase